jgi:hypothetical protein
MTLLPANVLHASTVPIISFLQASVFSLVPTVATGHTFPMEIAFPSAISATSLTIQMVSALPVAMDQLLIQTTDAYIAFHAEKDNIVLLTERAQKLAAIVETMTLKPASA